MEGIRKMSRLPGVVVVVDAKKEYLALREAKKLGIATIGIIDTDSDPDTVDVVIPANDDSIRAVNILLNELAEAVVVRNGKEVHRQEINAMEAESCWTDDEPLAKVVDKGIGGVYYYVKVRQHDGNLAWASPIWLTCNAT